MRSQEEYLVELDRDLDDILYDLHRTQGKLRETERALQSVREQLQLTDYEKIKERLDSCIRRLAEIPDERDESVQRKARLAETIRHAQEDLEHNEQQRQREKSRRDWRSGQNMPWAIRREALLLRRMRRIRRKKSVRCLQESSGTGNRRIFWEAFRRSIIRTRRI